ncbi:MAG: alpha-galactosidase [Solobacterium sp.]|nr:alpha-galactosidase [Solobacterium sp.]
MQIIYHEQSRTFHLRNSVTSYIFRIIDPGYPVHLYYGKAIHDREDFDHLLEAAPRPMSVLIADDGSELSLEHLKLEYPVYGTGDMRPPALDIRASNGSRLLDLRYESHRITEGKPGIPGLPAVYCDDSSEAMTLQIRLKDAKTGLAVILNYTVTEYAPAMMRSAEIINEGTQEIVLEHAMSLSLDLPDRDYDMIMLTGAWARERSVKRNPLHEGAQSISSMRGFSSPHFNPFIALCRKNCTETEGEVTGLSFVYSGNFLAEAYCDTYDTVRLRMGIHPDTFKWHLAPQASFHTPEAVLAYSCTGLNGMSQIFHKLYAERLVRGYWRGRPRPVLLNNWEATYFDFDEAKLLGIAAEAKKLGIELFVMDDGWFTNRRNDRSGLGDWEYDPERFPYGLGHYTEAIRDMGMMAGIWIEPEMVSPGTKIFREHPDWVIHEEGRPMHPGRHEYVLNFADPDVVQYIFEKLDRLLSEGGFDYVKWDMNRSMSDVFAASLPHQDELMHRYILGVYSLYERLIRKYPKTLFESCASGGGRFDPGMLYYAPQCWTSDDTDAYERQKIQYGTSMVYPVSSMGSHVSAVPNHQLGRTVSLKTRAETAYFGTFGYEMDVSKMTEDEKEQTRRHIAFMKANRQLLQFGTFWRLKSPFESNETVWMTVSEDKTEAVVAYYRCLQQINRGFRRIRLAGLDPDRLYHVSELEIDVYGDELMHTGLILSDGSGGERVSGTDFLSRLYMLRAVS